VDKRIKNIDYDAEKLARDQFFESVQKGELTFSEGVKAIRKLSKLTQPEFAKHRGISLGALRKIESGEANPQVDTLNKVGEIFGLEVGFVKKVKKLAKNS